MANTPADRFDDVPDDLLRTGAHRAARRRGRGWIAFAWAALFTGILVVGGLFGLAVIRGSIDIPFLSTAATPAASGSASASPSVSPSARSSASATPADAAGVNPALAITVLNGTTRKGLATEVGDYLVKQGWDGASTTVGSRSNVSGTANITKTVVYYGKAANRGAALALAATLKIGTASLSTAYPNSPLTVVLGSDFSLPAK